VLDNIDMDVENQDTAIQTPNSQKRSLHTQIQCPPELQQPPFYKLKSNFLLKLLPSRGWAKASPAPLHMSKCAQMPDQSCYVIGGAKDQQQQDTVNTVTLHQIKQGRVETREVKGMLQSRSCFGLTVDVTNKRIFVAGGQTSGVTTNRCEVYFCQEDRWQALPALNEDRGASSMTLLGGRWLYCVGGYKANPSNGDSQLLNTIECLDLSRVQDGWSLLQNTLPQQICDVGLCPLSMNEAMIFGGWVKPQTVQFCYILRRL
jgi:hypothetical protein